MTDDIGVNATWNDLDGEMPFADPAIRKEYEAALGRLILAHNELDMNVTRVIEKCLNELGNPVELKKLASGMFATRLENLRMLNAFSSGLKLRGIDFDELADLNGQRNIVAHGHFDQNPWEGDYQLVTNKQTHADYSIARLDGITTRLTKQSGSLEALYWFYDTAHIPTTTEYVDGPAPQ